MFRSALRPLARTLVPQTRAIHASGGATGGGGLTNLFDSGDNPALSVTKLTKQGFKLNDGLLIPGGCIFAEGRVLLWDVDPPKGDGAEGLAKAWEGWDTDRFRVFETLVPRPEILIFGTGERVLPAPKAIRDYISSLGIQLDVMDSRNAASTYNLLFEEGRTISAALCPLQPQPRGGQ